MRGSESREAVRADVQIIGMASENTPTVIAVDRQLIESLGELPRRIDVIILEGVCPVEENRGMSKYRAQASRTLRSLDGRKWFQTSPEGDYRERVVARTVQHPLAGASPNRVACWAAW